MAAGRTHAARTPCGGQRLARGEQEEERVLDRARKKGTAQTPF
jgi:hypothetical protein